MVVVMGGGAPGWGVCPLQITARLNQFISLRTSDSLIVCVGGGGI